jgi:hypothetical protein
VIIGAVVGGIVFSRRSRKASPWRAQAGAVLDESDQITTHLVGLTPDGLGSVAGADASRLAALVASAQQLVASAPDEAARQALAAMQPAVRSLQGAVDAVAMLPMAPSAATVDDVRMRATELHGATALARATLVPPSPTATRPPL